MTITNPTTPTSQIISFVDQPNMKRSPESELIRAKKRKMVSPISPDYKKSKLIDMKELKKVSKKFHFEVEKNDEYHDCFSINLPTPDTANDFEMSPLSDESKEIKNIKVSKAENDSKESKVKKTAKFEKETLPENENRKINQEECSKERVSSCSTCKNERKFEMKVETEKEDTKLSKETKFLLATSAISCVCGICSSVFDLYKS